MEITDGVYGLPQTLELEDGKEKIYPVAIEDGEGLVLVDAGLPENIEKVRENLEEHGFTFEDVEKLILTHQDFDHSGCAAELVEETGATVLAHRDDAPAIDGREQPIKGDERYPAVDVDIELSGGEKIRAGDKEIDIIHTPGHTPGHISLMVKDVLISGDALNNEDSGLEGPRERFTPEMESAVQSVNKLSFLDFNQVHCFHGGPVDAEPEDLKEIVKSLDEFKGFEKTSYSGPASFLRRELGNDLIGLSVFEVEAGEGHGTKKGPGTGHLHKEEVEIYYFEEGEGTFTIGDREVSYEKDDAFAVEPYKLRRVDAETDTKLLVAGAPPADDAEMKEF
ncbi:MAG: MBL fold metallo-hydrolase [Candidatus Nanohalobium sp.]